MLKIQSIAKGKEQKRDQLFKSIGTFSSAQFSTARTAKFRLIPVGHNTTKPEYEKSTRFV
ncbi:MAG: hypothetical protein GY795_50730 [Desulfobacterales bacterium]|nr:hypothetical protein [Desulfobacterales bacterium]